MRQSYLKPGLEAEVKPDSKRLAWAAGIYEGEGCVSLSRKSLKYPYSTLSVTVAQKDPYILGLLRHYFGGHISGNKRKPILYWRIHGARALGFLFTIFSWLSPRRKEQFKLKLQEII